MNSDNRLNDTEAFEMPKKCPTCSTIVTDDLPGGLCPSCLMAAARKSSPDYDPTEGIIRRIEPPSIDELAGLFPELDVKEMIGAGGMGAVYKARQISLDRMVAIKIFLFQDNDPRTTERFKQEARSLAKFNHQNIVTIHDVGKRGSFHYLMMEFVEGPNLRQVADAGELSPSEALALVPQLCDALQYAHDKGIVHRDIKPENVMLDREGVIKIADFGLAKITNQASELNLTNTRQVMGTLNYMAPEQRERPGDVDHRADIYSLGVVIYEMLTGELPLGRFDAPSKMVEMDGRMDEVVMRALEKEPSRRYQQASELKTGIELVAHLAPEKVTPVAPVKSSLATPKVDSDSDVQNEMTVSKMFFYGLATFVCCAGLFALILASDNFFEKEFKEFGGSLGGLMILAFGGYLFGCSSFFGQMISKTAQTRQRLLAAFGCVALAFGVAGVGLLILSEDTAQLIPIPKNAPSRSEQQALPWKLEEGALPTWQIRIRSKEDYMADREQLERTLRACGIGSGVMCGFLFAIYGMAYGLIENPDEKKV